MESWIVIIVVVAGLILVPRLLGGRKVSADVVKERIAAGARIVDVRSPAEFRGGAYPGAINIPLGELKDRWSELSKDQPVVVYCASGFRSANAAKLLSQLGFTNVVNAGGLNDMPR